MSVKTETRRAGDFILSEANGTLSRENGVIALGTLVPGTVLGQITASGKYVELDPDATDGSEDAAGVLYGHASGTDVPAVWSSVWPKCAPTCSSGPPAFPPPTKPLRFWPWPAATS